MTAPCSSVNPSVSTSDMTLPIWPRREIHNCGDLAPHELLDGVALGDLGAGLTGTDDQSEINHQAKGRFARLGKGAHIDDRPYANVHGGELIEADGWGSRLLKS